MRVSLIALGLLLSTTYGFSFHNPATSAHRPSTALHVASELSTSNDDTTASKLGLNHPPISLFGKGQRGASGSDAKAILGGKGANLAEMSSIGLSVPPGFTITAECCDRYCNEWNGTLPDELWEDIVSQLGYIEGEMDCEFGSRTNPLLLSVRSGAAISMPGMMDTVLNLGMNDEVVIGLANKSNNARFAWDSYRRFLEMFGNVVLEIERSKFEEPLDDIKYEKGVYQDSDLKAEDLQEVVEKFKRVYTDNGHTFPQDPLEQLRLAIGAVFNGWMGDRAVKYREVENIRGLLGTAVNVQAMVFGNMGETSGTG